MSAREEAVFKALANPVRREILDLLRDQPRNTGELAEHFHELSRFAVMQHLGVLEDAKLVLSTRQGRQRINSLNPVPLREVLERWMQPFAERMAGEMLALRKYVEGQEEE